MLYRHPVIGGELLDDPLTAEAAYAAVLLSTKGFVGTVDTALLFLPESETLIRGNPIQARPVVAEPTLTQPILTQPVITRSIGRHPRFRRAVYAVDRAPHPRTKCLLRSPAVHRLAR